MKIVVFPISESSSVFILDANEHLELAKLILNIVNKKSFVSFMQIDSVNFDKLEDMLIQVDKDNVYKEAKKEYEPDEFYHDELEYCYDYWTSVKIGGVKYVQVFLDYTSDFVLIEKNKDVVSS